MEMAPSIPVKANLESRQPIATFAVLDLETSNLPAFNNNRTSITELCIYAFDTSVIGDGASTKNPDFVDDLAPPEPPTLPSPPRVLHKLNLLFQPSMLVHPEAENKTGLNNYILERESKLNTNAGELILRFLEHLPAPVCLVAHNGWFFDFPIIRQVFEKLNITLPASMLCLDSLRSFMEIDDKRTAEQTLEKSPQVEDENNVEAEIKMEKNEKPIDWKTVNETTPKRRPLTQSEVAAKRHRLHAVDEDSDEDVPASKRKPEDIKARRKLFAGLKCSQTKRFPPKGRYKLTNLFERIFEKPATNAHQAEVDVIMLTKLIQHYGTDFLAFAEEQAIPFEQVLPLGGKNVKR